MNHSSSFELVSSLLMVAMVPLKSTESSSFFQSLYLDDLSHCLICPSDTRSLQKPWKFPENRRKNFRLLFPKMDTDHLLKMRVWTGHAQGTKNRGCTMFKRCLKKWILGYILRHFSQKNRGCTCTPGTPPSASPEWNYSKLPICS